MSSELAFRAQLVINEQREIYDYWRQAANSRAMPARADLDPVAIRHLLPGISILDVGARFDALRYRLAGTRLHDIFGCEVTGLSVFDLRLGAKRRYWLSAYRRVVEQHMPMQGAVKGPVAGRDHVVLFWLRLPLSEDGEAVSKILCHDVGIMPAALATDDASEDEPEAISE
jgi:hypothetical protein